MDFEWVTESLKVDAFLPEEVFEINFASYLDGAQDSGARNSRLSTEPLLKRMSFYVEGILLGDKITRTEVTEMLSKLGADIVDSLHDCQHSEHVCLILDTDTNMNDPKVEDICRTSFKQVVDIEWLYDSISCYKRHPFKEYNVIFKSITAPSLSPPSESITNVPGHGDMEITHPDTCRVSDLATEAPSLSPPSESITNVPHHGDMEITHPDTCRVSDLATEAPSFSPPSESITNVPHLGDMEITHPDTCRVSDLATEAPSLSSPSESVSSVPHLGDMEITHPDTCRVSDLATEAPSFSPPSESITSVPHHSDMEITHPDTCRVSDLATEDVEDDDARSDYVKDSSDEYQPSEWSGDSEDEDYSETESNFSEIVPVMSKSNCKGVTSEAPQNEYIVVLQTNNVGGRTYDKKHYCLYCEKPQAKLPRHLISKHKNEVQVAKYMAEENKDLKKKMLLKIRNMGIHSHNCQVIREGKGDLIVAYRPSNDDVSWKDFSPCPHCFGYYASSSLWKHTKRCLFASSEKKFSRILANSRLLLPSTIKASNGLKKLMSSFKEDNISTIIKNDPLIILLGEKLLTKHGHDTENNNYIRNTLREMGRLLNSLQEMEGTCKHNLEHFMHPPFYEKIVQATKNVCGFSEENQKYEIPSLALKIGYSLQKCAGIIRGKALEKEDVALEHSMDRMIKLYEENWSDDITFHAHRTLGELKRNTVKLIPLTVDVAAFSKYLSEKGDEIFAVLSKKLNHESWRLLSEIVLAQILLFNRRRQGEVSKLSIEDYSKRHTAEKNDLSQGLSSLEKKLCGTLEKVDVIGKRGRPVPIIFTKDNRKKIDLLLETRKEAGVHPDNPFIFSRASKSSTEHIRGSDVLREHSVLCGAKYPTLLRSTKLRKQIATLSQILNLKDNELDILANYMGHDIRVHREYYRLPQDTLQVAKVAKILQTMDKGEISDHIGKSLDEIEIDPDEEVQLPADVDDSDDDLGDDSEDLSLDDLTENLDEEPSQLEIHSPKTEVRRKGTGKGKTGRETVAKKRTCQKVPWSEGEKNAVRKHFRKKFISMKLPGKAEIDKCLKAEEVLKNRSWKNVKDFIRNTLTSKKKNE